jgi:hypothetical protein
MTTARKSANRCGEKQLNLAQSDDSRRSVFQFSLKTAFFVTFLASVGMSWFVSVRGLMAEARGCTWWCEVITSSLPWTVWARIGTTLLIVCCFRSKAASGAAATTIHLIAVSLILVLLGVTNGFIRTLSCLVDPPSPAWIRASICATAVSEVSLPFLVALIAVYRATPIRLVELPKGTRWIVLSVVWSLCNVALLLTLLLMVL